jgi:hypothetical protein
MVEINHSASSETNNRGNSPSSNSRERPGVVLHLSFKQILLNIEGRQAT